MDDVDIDTMEAGPELDILVLEVVFGFPRRKVFYHDWDTGYAHPQYIPSGKSPRTHMIDAQPVPRYSKQSAWLVVERMHSLIPTDRLGPWSFLILVCTGHTTGWVASFDFDLDAVWYEYPEVYPYAAKGLTPGLAICRAALRACQSKE